MISMNYSSLFQKIKESCLRGESGDIDTVMGILAKADLPTTKAVDRYLGSVNNPDGIRQLEYYLFSGTQIQRNYSTLFFARRDEWHLVNRAYAEGLIDWLQAYSR